ncbi:MAG: hypothetical protein JXB49_31330 [Bacteroidales bacterium]|nr:hypothetical protein [Bacteroidales bacterium]
MNKKKELRVVKVAEIGNMVSIEDCIGAINDAMKRCNHESTVWATYQAVVDMLKTINETYELEFKSGIQPDDLGLLVKSIELNDFLKN